jgi:hypothetical protein
MTSDRRAALIAVARLGRPASVGVTRRAVDEAVWAWMTRRAVAAIGDRRGFVAKSLES